MSTRLPLFLSHNIFNDIQNPTHIVDANDEVAGNEAWRVGTGRRASGRNKWTMSVVNSAGWVRVDCGVNVTCDTFVLDRGHNLSGHSVSVQGDGNSGFTSPQYAFTQNVPSTVVTGDDLSALPGVLTEEGAYCIRWDPPITERYWRIYIAAMGAGLKPEITGAYLGLGYEPSYHMELPIEDESGESFYEEVISDTAWAAASRAAARRSGIIHLKLSTEAEYTDARTTIRDYWWRQRAPMWIWHDQMYAERAVCTMPAQGKWGFYRDQGWFFRQARFGWAEHEPLASV